MFKELKEINHRPAPFEFYTASELWTNDHTSKKMLEFHLNEAIDLSSRNKKFIEDSVKWIASHFKIKDKTKIADFGCGPGLYTTRFAEIGAQVTGIDFSENSINYAKSVADQKGLNIEYFQQNYLEFHTEERFDLITMIFCDFCALSPKQRNTMLSKFYSLLKPKGSVLLDVHSLNIFNQTKETASYELNQLNGFWSANDYYAFKNTFKYDKEKVTLDKYTIIEASQKRVVYNWLQYFSKESLKKTFLEAGFKIHNLYSDVAGKTFTPESPDIAIIATKP